MAMARMATAATAATVEGATWSCTAVSVQQRFVVAWSLFPGQHLVVRTKRRGQLSSDLPRFVGNQRQNKTREKIRHRTTTWVGKRPCSKRQTSKKQSRNMHAKRWRFLGEHAKGRQIQRNARPKPRTTKLVVYVMHRTP
eukprot:scaffold75539_cov66-Phaeocystis_antarctica.AAC.2